MSTTPLGACLKGGFRVSLYCRGLHAWQSTCPGLEAIIVASISRCWSIVKNWTPYTSSSTASFSVSGMSQKMLCGPRDTLLPLSVSSRILWMAARSLSSAEKNVTQTVSESGTIGYVKFSWSMQPCGGHEAEPTLLESRPAWGLQVRTLGSHTCSTSGDPVGHSQIVKFLKELP